MLLTLTLCACTTMTKETYTERREFKYPKGTTPHIKDMYMHNKVENQVQIRRAEPIPTDHDFLNGDVKYYNPTKSLNDIQNENALLYAMKVNNMLKGIQ